MLRDVCVSVRWPRTLALKEQVPKQPFPTGCVAQCCGWGVTPKRGLLRAGCSPEERIYFICSSCVLPSSGWCRGRLGWCSALAQGGYFYVVLIWGGFFRVLGSQGLVLPQEPGMWWRPCLGVQVLLAPVAPLVPSSIIPPPHGVWCYLNEGDSHVCTSHSQACELSLAERKCGFSKLNLCLVYQVI